MLRHWYYEVTFMFFNKLSGAFTTRWLYLHFWFFSGEKNFVFYKVPRDFQSVTSKNKIIFEKTNIDKKILIFSYSILINFNSTIENPSFFPLSWMTPLEFHCNRIANESSNTFVVQFWEILHAKTTTLMSSRNLWAKKMKLFNEIFCILPCQKVFLPKISFVLESFHLKSWFCSRQFSVEFVQFCSSLIASRHTDVFFGSHKVELIKTIWSRSMQKPI